MGVGISTKVLAIFIIIILTSSSFQVNFLNLQKSSSDVTQTAFAQTAPVANINQIGNYAVFALHNAVIANNVTFNTGSLGAQNAQPNMALPANAEVIIKQNSKFNDPTSAVVGDSVIINSGTTVQNVFYNELQNSGTVVGTQNTPLALPVVNSLPPFPRSTPGTTTVDVPMDSSVTLQPGQYGPITVEQGGTVNFVGGIYNITSITAKQNSNLTFNAPSQVVVQNQITWNKGTFVGPSSDSGLHSHDIIIYVGGNSTINQNTTSTDFGKDATIDVNMYAPTGSIEMDQGTNATGAFIANTVTVQQDSVINLDSAFGSKITWMPSSLNVEAKPDVPLNLNFTSTTSLQNVNVLISSQLTGIVVPSENVIPTINQNVNQTLPVTILISPTITSGWHNGTVSLFSNGNQLQNSFNLNIFVPTVTSSVVQTSKGNFTNVATPSSSPFFTNTYDVATYFTFTNGTTIPLRVYYDVFTNSSTTIPVSLHLSTSKSSNLFMIAFDYFESIENKLSTFNIWKPHEASAITSESTCTSYAMTYHFNSYPTTISNDLAVATSALNANPNPLIIRNDISWGDVDKGSFNSNGNWVPQYDDTKIDNYFNNVITAGKTAIVILGVHSPPAAIAEKGTNFFGQPYAQYAYANAANAFINHTINRIKTLGALDRVQYWQLDNEPNLHPMLKSSTNDGIFGVVVDWQTTSTALNLWANTIKTLDPGSSIIINVYQVNPGDIIPQALQSSGQVFFQKPFDNLLPTTFASSPQLAGNIGIMGFDIYPDQWVNPLESITSGFNTALSQAQYQITDAQNNFAFSGRWGIVEMPAAPTSIFALTTSDLEADFLQSSDVSSMINTARNDLINGQPPALIGLFQLRAPNDLSRNSLFPPYNNTYGLITDSSSQTNSAFYTAIQSSVVQNCPPPTGQLTVVKKIINTGGGTLTISGVTLQINGTTVTNGTANTLTVGKYTVSENPVSGYTSTISGDCASDGTITLNANDTKTCIITNTFVSPVFFENFDDGPLTSNGWSPVSCYPGYDCVGQSTTSQLGYPAISPPYWGFVRNVVFNAGCAPNSAATSKSFTVTQAGNYNVSAWTAPSICEGCIIYNQLLVDGNLLFNHGLGFGSSPPVFDQTVIPLSAGTHTVTMQMYATAECNGAFPTYMDNIGIQSTNNPVPAAVVGGPYFTLQVNQTSYNATSPSTIVVPLKVIWEPGWSAENVSGTFMGNTTSIVPSITSVANTTSSQLFNMTLNVQPNVQAGNYNVAIQIAEPDGDSQVSSIFVRVQ